MPTLSEMHKLIQKKPSEHYGLLWTPTIGRLDDVDFFGAPFGRPSTQFPPIHFTDLDRNSLNGTLAQLVAPKLIVEIGVDRSESFNKSSTGCILNWKPSTCTYIGIDINNKAYLTDTKNRIYTLQNDSKEHDKLYTKMAELALEQIDLMFVDGWHSVNQVLAEWKYWERMIPEGVMTFHDINYHPGPIAVLEAADPTIFDVTYYGRNEPLDWGVGVVKRKSQKVIPT